MITFVYLFFTCVIASIDYNVASDPLKCTVMISIIRSYFVNSGLKGIITPERDLILLL